jgi:hypothetical protein
MDSQLAKIPLVVSYGLGVDSTAVLVGLQQRGIRPDAILFSDTGSEKEETYDYLVTINAWLQSVGFPLVTVVRNAPRKFKYNRYSTLAGNCISNRTLPSLAFGKKGCSLKWKGEIMDRWVNRVYGQNTAVYRAIGYDCSPADNKRFAHAQGKANAGRKGDVFIYPLQQWGWHRIECAKQIAAAGLPVPPKSSCYFCPAMKQHEVEALPADKLRAIVIIEANAWPIQQHREVKGLWRAKRMTDFIRIKGLLPATEIDRLWAKWSAPDRVITVKEIASEDVLGADAAGRPELAEAA